MVDITIVNGVYKPTYNWGAPSCRLYPLTSRFLLLQWPFLGGRHAGGRPGCRLWRAPQRGGAVGAGHDVGGFPGRAAADHAAHVVHGTGVGMGMGWGSRFYQS